MGLSRFAGFSGVADAGGDLGDGDDVAGVALDELREQTRSAALDGGWRRRTHLLTQLAEDVLRVKLDESIAKGNRHLVDRAGVRPVRIVHRGERNLVLRKKQDRQQTTSNRVGQGRTLQARAVIIMCVASREWMKLGGNAVA